MNELPRCYYCTRPLTPDIFSWDHMIPRCRGGSSWGNQCPACKPCNNRKGPLTAEEFMAVRHDNRARKALITEVLRSLSEARDQVSQEIRSTG